MLGQFSFSHGGPSRRPHALPGRGPGLRPGVAACGRLRYAFALCQPWRCLCLGSVQMTMTRPCRRMIRHLLQIFLTLGLTFTAMSPLSLILLAWFDAWVVTCTGTRCARDS